MIGSCRPMIGNNPFAGAGGVSSSIEYSAMTNATPDNQCQVNTGTIVYNAITPQFDVAGIDHIDINISSHSGSAVYNVGLYNELGARVRTATITTTGTGINSSTTFADLEIGRTDLFWIAITKKSGGSNSILCQTTNTEQSVCKNENVSSPYDLPVNIGTTSAGNSLLVLRLCGTVGG